jgi:hypothetical protein
VSLPDDPAVERILSRLGVSPAALLGRGGQAHVYALDADRVVRIPRDGRPEDVWRGQRLVDELMARGAPFAMPEVLAVDEVDGRLVAIERRLPGRSVLDALALLEGPPRDALIERHFEAATALGGLHLEPRPWYGELTGLDAEPVRTPMWQDYLVARAARSLGRTTARHAGLDPGALAADLPGCDDPGFVFLDAFAGNMLTDGRRITAVIDIGPYGVVGDVRLNVLAAAVHLAAPEITPTARPRDVDVARSWLRSAGLLEWLDPAQRWLAAFWSFATDDHRLQEWCRSVLAPGRR